MVGLALILGFLFSSTSSPAWALDNPPIRVRLETSIQKLELEGLGVQIRGRETNFQFVAIPQKQKIEISRDEDKGFWKVLRGDHLELVADPILALKSIDLRSGGKSLPSQIFLTAQKKNKFDVIGVLPLESYLVGVVASEMPLSWPVETLKAQAIAARSYALVTMKERANQSFHVESNILDQVFSHIGNSADENPLVAKAKLAVHSTEGIVLLDPKSAQVLKAFYHSDCGGKTASAKSVWGVGSAAGSTVDSACPSNPKAHWNLQVSEQDLMQKLKTHLKRADLGSLEFFSLLRPSLRDRVEKIQLVWSGGVRLLMSAQDFRSVLGFDQMKSTFFQMRKEGNEYQFSGQGFGHGVGLCQWGARQLGKEGRSFDQILSHYYPQSRIDRFALRSEPKLEDQIR